VERAIAPGGGRTCLKPVKKRRIFKKLLEGWLWHWEHGEPKKTTWLSGRTLNFQGEDETQFEEGKKGIMEFKLGKSTHQKKC